MTVAAYDSIAEWYDRSIREETLLPADDLTASDLFRTVGSLDARKVCDLACGQGVMAWRCARVVGLDISKTAALNLKSTWHFTARRNERRFPRIRE